MTSAESCLPTDAVSIEAPVGGLDNTLILYAATVKVETTPDGFSTYYAFRTLPSLSSLDPAIFDTFYGESMQIEPIGMFLDEFHPQLSPNEQYLLVPGLASYPEYGVEGTGTWLIDLEAGEARYDIWTLPAAPNSTAERLIADAVLIDAVPERAR